MPSARTVAPGSGDQAGGIGAYGRCGLSYRQAVLEDEGCVFLVTFSRKADVIELDLIHAQLGYVLGQGDVVILNFGVGGIGPNQLSVFAPGSVILAGLDCELGVLGDQAFVTEDGDAGNGVHVLLVQEADQLGDVMDVDLMFSEERVLEGNRHAAVGVLDVENDGVAANFTPVTDNVDSLVAGRHDSSEIDGADFEILRNGHGLFGNGSEENSGDDDGFVGFKNVAGVGLVIDGADRGRQLRGGQV